MAKFGYNNTYDGKLEPGLEAPMLSPDDLLGGGLIKGVMAGVKSLPLLAGIFHGGSYKAGSPITKALYTAADRKMAESYVDKLRNPASKLSEFSHNAVSQAPESEVLSLAKQLGIDNQYYTPASAFDSGLHGDRMVSRLLEALRAKGYDHAVLPDIPMSGGGEFPATVLFPGVITK